MNLEDAHQLMMRPVPLDLAAKAFGCAPILLAPQSQEGQIALGQVFTLARKQAEARLRAVRFAHRSTFMKTRMSVQRAARAFVDLARLALALAALRQAVVAVIRDLEARLRPYAPRLADLACRAAEAVLTVDPASARRPKRRAAR